MTGYPRRILFSLALIALAAVLAGPPGFGGELTAKPPYKVGVVTTLFRDVPEPAIPGLLRPFQIMLESQTGLPGKLTPVRGWEQLSQDLSQDKVQLGLFHGFEFAWAREKYPDLRPLVVVVGKVAQPRAHLVTLKGNKDCNMGDWSGWTLAIPSRTREYCHLFLERHLARHNKTVKESFRKVTAPRSVEDAVNQLVEGDVQAVLLDSAALEGCRARKPQVHNMLKTIEQSDPFPPGVFAYRPGAVDEGTVKQFVKGMLVADQDPESREIMGYAQIQKFDDVPPEYDEMLKTIARTYPPATAKTK